MENNTIFREKNLKKAADPEQLNTCLKVTGVRPWLFVIAAGLVLAAIFIWLFSGEIRPPVTGAGYCEDGILTCYFRQTDIDEISPASAVKVKDKEYRITEICAPLYLYSDLPNDILYLVPEDQWYKTVTVDCDDLEDGLYVAEIRGKDIGPASSLKQGDQSP